MILAKWEKRCLSCGKCRGARVKRMGDCNHCATEKKAQRKWWRDNWWFAQNDRQYRVRSEREWINPLQFQWERDAPLRGDRPFMDELVCEWCDGKMGNSNQYLSSLLPNFPHPEENYRRGEAACWRCYNKHRHADRILNEAEETRLAIGRTQREISNERKRRKDLEDNGRSEAIPR